jgi:hypothetical protein
LRVIIIDAVPFAFGNEAKTFTFQCCFFSSTSNCRWCFSDFSQSDLSSRWDFSVKLENKTKMQLPIRKDVLDPHHLLKDIIGNWNLTCDLVWSIWVEGFGSPQWIHLDVLGRLYSIKEWKQMQSTNHHSAT